MVGDLILYQFSRSKVEGGDFSHFLSLYAPDKLPEGRPLRDLLNRFVFCIEGWDDDPREIHLIPEIRRFYSSFHEAWPYWLYFCNLDVDTLRSMTMCCLSSVNTMQKDGHTQVAVTCDPLELLNFIKHDLMPMNLRCEQAEMSERGIYERTKAVFEYFGFPFDAEPPSAETASGAYFGAQPMVPQPKLGRNDPCPCGSGKKYKKCCGKS
jgi:hypothetical protein